MPISFTEDDILQDILDTCTELFNLTILDATPIHRGWLNLKWKVKTQQGVLLIKQYNKERLKKYKLTDIERALNQQNRLRSEGLTTPRIWTCNGEVIQRSKCDELFIVMDFCDGRILRAGQLEKDHMFELGLMTGKMHDLLNDGRLPPKAHPIFLPPRREQRLQHWENLLNDVGDRTISTTLVAKIETQIVATEQMEGVCFGATGWSHRDLWFDNLLFEDQQLTSILDFDRLGYDYPELDVARAVIGGSLYKNECDTSLALAFLEGYNRFRTFGTEQLIGALKGLWYMESEWWIDHNTEQLTGPPARFAEEMHWLANNLVVLESMFLTKE
ncbi:phosphotransferase [Alkalicoccobacillus murimartini]|uniref:Homoserine kinase type II n=1 Tax=Alkalicoccobacillus murimartini TaxID=171685 RepID=A0ABT9YK23_9BACI|nr:phosphotransferase [Alkalicoccobacillus murimartini]MDQ0207567.1 homoserine kinase type II [Alkalicoccobacillus murimartini]